MDAALRDMGALWLRYPGGEKSDYYLWAHPPHARPRPASPAPIERAFGVLSRLVDRLEELV